MPSASDAISAQTDAMPSRGAPATVREYDNCSSVDHRGRIAMRAYELFLARGGADGRDFDDWLAAERELTGGAGLGSRGDAGK